MKYLQNYVKVLKLRAADLVRLIMGSKSTMMMMIHLKYLFVNVVDGVSRKPKHIISCDKK